MTALLPGCMTVGDLAALDQMKERELETLVPTCTPATCEELMGRAREWLAAHADFPIEHASADYVTTARDAGQASGKLWGYVRRERLDDTLSRLPLTLRCNHPFGCNRDPYKLRRQFYEAMAAP